MTTTFLIMADTHFMVPGSGRDMTWWNRMLKARSAEIADALVSTVAALDPDFVVHCGDITDNGTMPSLRQARETFDRMGCPCYLTLGNHDTWHPGARAAIAGLFDMGEGACYYARDLGGARFVFLDCAYWIRRDGQEDEHIDWDLHRAGGYQGIGPSTEELDWLESELTANDGRPAIIVAHPPMQSSPAFPVGSFPRGQPVKRYPSPVADFTTYCVGHERLRRIITSAGNVKSVFTGHWHIFDAHVQNGTQYCQTGSMIEYPFQMRLVKIDDGRMSLTTVPLSDRSFEKDSLLEELGNGWVAGERKDRALEIDLT